MYLALLELSVVNKSHKYTRRRGCCGWSTCSGQDGERRKKNEKEEIVGRADRERMVRNREQMSMACS